MADNQISASSIRKLIKKLKKRRRANPESLEFLSKIIFYSTAFLTLTANDISERDGSSFVKNSDFRRVFESFGIEKIYDETYKEFLEDYVEK